MHGPSNSPHRERDNRNVLEETELYDKGFHRILVTNEELKQFKIRNDNLRSQCKFSNSESRIASIVLINDLITI